MEYIDSVDVVMTFLEDQTEIPPDSVTGDLNTREAGDTTIYLNESLLIRAIRDREERADIEYDVYHQDRGEAKKLAHLVRQKLLEVLPGLQVGNAEILDTEEIEGPIYHPDTTSREHIYCGEVTLFYVEAI